MNLRHQTIINIILIAVSLNISTVFHFYSKLAILLNVTDFRKYIIIYLSLCFRNRDIKIIIIKRNIIVYIYYHYDFYIFFNSKNISQQQTWGSEMTIVHTKT